MRQLRVAFLDQVGVAPGGAEQTLATFLEHMPSGIAPNVILFEDGPFADRLRALGLPVDVVPIPGAIGASTRERMRIGGALRIPAVALKVARIVRERRAALLYTNSMKAHLIGAFAARLAGVRCVMHFHDVVDGAARTALRSAARLASRERIACSRLVSERIGLAPTRVIYAPLELAAYDALPDRAVARAALQLPDDDLPVVTIVGRINRWKGHDRFLRIAARVNAEIPARFVIVGTPIFRDADFLPELQARAAEAPLRGRVSFVPWLDDVRVAYAATDVNCNCSTQEPFGRTVVEAAAAGVPTVCFDDSGAAETVIDGVTGRAVRAGDEAAFARAIIEYLRDPAVLLAARKAARGAAARFDAERIADEMAHVILRAVA